MSPELIDKAILACCKPEFLKVARVLGDVAKLLNGPKVAEKDVGLIADRIKALVKAARLESQGDLDQWRFSEIRLPEK